MVSVRDPFASLLRLGVVHKGHFVYTSGLHGEWYVTIGKGEYAPLSELSELCRLMAAFSGDTVQVVVGAAKGGTTIGKLVAEHFGQLLSRTIPFVLLEKVEDGSGLVICDEQVSVMRGKPVLAVDDVLHTGKTLRQLIETVERAGGKVMGVSVVWNRGSLRAHDLRVPWLYAPIVHQLPSYTAPCPLCLQDIPVNTDMGHGKEFLAQKANPAD